METHMEAANTAPPVLYSRWSKTVGVPEPTLEIQESILVTYDIKIDNIRCTISITSDQYCMVYHASGTSKS